MTSTPTSVLGLELQGQNDNSGSWWSNLNQVIQSAEDSVAKEVAIATAGGDTALTLVPYAVDQSRCAIVRVGAGQTLLSLARITTARARLYFVTNETAGGAFAVQFGGNVSNLVTVARGCGAWVRVRSDSTTTFAGPLVNLTTGAIDGSSLASGAFLLGANNLSDLANAATARTNLGLVIGTNVQAYAANLTTWAGLAPSANGQSLVTSANYASMVSLLGLVIGTNTQAYNANLTTYAGIAPSANIQSLLGSADYPTARTNLGVAYAAKADLQAASSGALVVPPAQVQNHPGVAKAWVVYNLATQTVVASYNVTSVSRDGQGIFTVNFTTAFTSSNYTFVGTVEGSASQSAIISRIAGYTRTASACQLFASSVNGTTGFDSAWVSVAFFGTQ